MRLFIISIALLGVTALGASAKTPQNTFILCDFENETELARFELRNTDSLQLTDKHVAHGDFSARVSFPRWNQEKEEFCPAIILPMGNGLPTDWTPYNYLTIEARNESAHVSVLAFYIRDTEGQAVGPHFYMPPGKTETLRFNLDSQNLNLASIQEMHIFYPNTQRETSFVIDFLRLEEDSIIRLDAVDVAIAELKRSARNLGLDALFRDLEKQCDELRGKLLSESNLEVRKRLRMELQTIEDRVREDISRIVSEERMRAEFRRINRGVPYACGFATSMEKVFPKDIPFNARVARYGEVELAGNEVESIQLLILAEDQALQDVKVTVDNIRRSDRVSVRRKPEIQVSPVGFVETKKPPYPVDYIGWHPDPILDFLTSVDIKAGEMQPIWIRVKTPAGTPEGEYLADITVIPANAPEVNLGLKINVWGFDLPDETSLRTAMSLREHFIKQVHGEFTQELWNKYCDFLLEYRLNPDNIYSRKPPRIGDLLRWEQRGMNAFNLRYVMTPRDHEADAPFPEDMKKEIMEQLHYIVPKLKEHGLYEKAYLYGFDEIFPHLHNALNDMFSTIKTKYPDLLLMTTAYEDSYGKGSGLTIVDAWVPLTPKYDVERAERKRAKGKEIWWYICVEPRAPYANWFIEYDAIEARSLMGLQTAKYRPDGFLYYAVNRWPLSKKPITEGPYTDWPPASYLENNGDGSIMCAGPDGPLATIRLENIRDGIEDFEYFILLEKEIERLKKTHGPEARNALRQAQRAAVIGDDLVKSVQEYSKCPEELYAQRRQVAEAILAARKVR